MVNPIDVVHSECHWYHFDPQVKFQFLRQQTDLLSVTIRGFWKLRRGAPKHRAARSWSLKNLAAESHGPALQKNWQLESWNHMEPCFFHFVPIYDESIPNPTSAKSRHQEDRVLQLTNCWQFDGENDHVSFTRLACLAPQCWEVTQTLSQGPNSVKTGATCKESGPSISLREWWRSNCREAKDCDQLGDPLMAPFLPLVAALFSAFLFAVSVPPISQPSTSDGFKRRDTNFLRSEASTTYPKHMEDPRKKNMNFFLFRGSLSSQKFDSWGLQRSTHLNDHLSSCQLSPWPIRTPPKLQRFTNCADWNGEHQ